MGPLVSKIQHAIESQFQAKIVTLNITREGDMWGVQFGGAMQAYTVRMEVVESKHRVVNGEYPAHSIQHMMKNGLFDEILNGNGRLMSMSTNMGPGNSFRTELQFVTHDLIAFAEALDDFGWKSYSREFDSLVEEALTDDILQVPDSIKLRD